MAAIGHEIIPDDDSWWDDIARPLTSSEIARIDHIKHAWLHYIESPEPGITTEEKTIDRFGCQIMVQHQIIGHYDPVLIMVTTTHNTRLSVIYAESTTRRKVFEYQSQCRFNYTISSAYNDYNAEIARRISGSISSVIDTPI